MIDLVTAQKLDQEDILANFKNYFENNSNEIYLDGNSLGKLPKKTLKILQETIQNQWGKRLIRSWNEIWLDLPLGLAKKYGALLNIKKEEVIIGESTSVRLYQILHALINSKKYTNKLSSDNLNFPTDLYILEGLANEFNLSKVNLINYKQEIFADLNLLKKNIQNNQGIYCLSLVTFKSSFLYPMKDLNLWAEENNSIIVWDLSHAIGAVEIDLKETQTKIALGCSYKFMNGGPGSPAFLFIQKKLQDLLHNPIKGWFGHQNPFNFAPNYLPDSGINRFASGTTQVLSMQAMEPGIDITLEAGIKNLRKKSIALSEFFLNGIEEELIPLGFKIQSPSNSDLRGSHLTISHPASWQICQALIQGESNALKVIPDYRPPNLLRFGIAPLYTSYENIFRVLIRIKEIVKTESYKKFEIKKTKVT
ncbi:aminotransferase class V-fold PLP-dependent enzyme [Flavobacteriaceae bacterium]|jgi:kynureninase|nr:aminotransferase class V-fold PLP-dependent enzyme [Flavobacteriaceae bacterium]